jgi:hypothetical protein
LYWGIMKVGRSLRGRLGRLISFFVSSRGFFEDVVVV